jgi:Peptidase family M28
MRNTLRSILAITTVAWVAAMPGTAILRSQSPAQGATAAPQPDERRLRTVPDDQFLRYPVLPSEQSYSAIDGTRLKEYVREITAISRRYRDRGHQYWGRIMGTEADGETAQWMLEKFQKAGLVNTRIQPLDLPPQWMPQSWEVVVAGSGRSVTLASVQPESRLPAELSGQRELEAVYVGWGAEADFAGRDVRGKAVFIYSMPMPGVRNTSATRNNAAGRAIARGAAAVFNVVELPGNVSGMWSFTPAADRGKVPAFMMGSADGAAVRDLIERAPSGQAPRVRIRLDIRMVPGLKTANVWGELPGTSDETVIVVAHRDGFFEGADDNGSGMATLIGMAEYFAKVPRERRRRTIRFVGSSGHHGTAAGVQWMADNKDEVFGKTALLINCEHTALTAVYGFAGSTRSNSTAAKGLYVTPGPLTPIVLNALRTFGVPTYAGISDRPAGEIGRLYQFAPSMQLIDASLYYHTDAEVADLIPAAGLEQVTRAYAKIVDEVNKLTLAQIRAASAPSTGGR